MPKEIITGNKVLIDFDLTNPQDKLKQAIKQNKGKGKGKDSLNTSEKAALFDIYFDAGIIKF
jgi:hypothetical protein